MPAYQVVVRDWPQPAAASGDMTADVAGAPAAEFAHGIGPSLAARNVTRLEDSRSKYSVIFRRPSRNGTRGCHALASVMSGQRRVGSSLGSGANRISDLELVISTISSASSSTVHS
jgi:hypothetical protein